MATDRRFALLKHQHALADAFSDTFATGDILYFDGTNLVTLAAGSDTEVLTLASGVPSWAAAGSGIANVVEDTTPQLGGSLDVNGQKIVSVSNGNIDIEPNGTGNVLLGNFTFDADQTVGAGQDNYVLTYDNGTGLISLEAASGGSSALGDLTDVTITAAIAGDYIRYSGSAWVDVTVSQLETDINHDNLTGFVANEHIDWTSTSSNFSTTGTLGAGAITATSYDGVAAANLLDKTAAETVSGIYTFSASPVISSGSLFIDEGAADEASQAGKGQFWVQDDAPNRPYFTDDGDTAYPLSFAKWVNVSEDAADTVDWQYMNGIAFKDGTAGVTYTLEASSATTFEVGSNCTFINAHATTGDITINEGTSTTLYLLDGSTVTDTAGGCTLGPGGYATVYRHSATVYYVMGAGLTA